MSYDEMIAVIQAHKEGKRIEMLSRDAKDGQWVCLDKPIWDFNTFRFRVKPEPREWWLVKNYDGWFEYKAYDCKQDSCENIRVREVIE